MRISDWSSDVCSSDLNVGGHRGDLTARADQKANTIAAYGEGRLILAKGLTAIGGLQFTSGRRAVANLLAPARSDARTYSEWSPKLGLLYEPSDAQIGRASCRERVCQYV